MGPPGGRSSERGPRRVGARRDKSSLRSALAEGSIDGSDRIVVELLSPPDMPQVIMIRDHDDLGYGHRPLAPANLRQSTTCKGDTVTRPSANGTADSVTTAPTLPSSLPAAEFRLPLLIGVFGFLALQALIMNKAMSLIVVLTALPARLAAVPIDALTPYWFVVVNLLAGSLIGAWIGATWATRMRSATLYRVLAALLVLIAAALASSHLGHLDPLTIQPVPRAIIGLLVGVGIGVVAALMGVAGGELLIPTIVLLFAVDIKIAGSLALAISLPTMLVAFAR
jgi:hypothetical protein